MGAAYKLSREQLYELVWSMPMVHAAKSLDISDVMLCRICADRNIPKPPRGYWAALKFGKHLGRFIKPPLPSLFESKNDFEHFMLTERQRQSEKRPDDFDPYDLEEPIPDPPAPFSTSLEDYQNYLEAHFPDLPQPSQITTIDAALEKVVTTDTALAKAYKRGGNYYSPLYQDAKGKQTFQLLNAYFHWFKALGFDLSVTGRNNFRFWVTLFGDHKEFHVFMNEPTPGYSQNKHRKEKAALTYCFAWTNNWTDETRKKRFFEFDSFTTDCVKKVVMSLAVERERIYRARVFSSYESRVELRQRVIVDRAERIRLAGEAKRRATQQLLKARLTLMNEATNRMNQADLIRSLIDSFKAKAERSRRPIKGLQHWVSWASHLANVTDPRHMSAEGIEAWIKKFNLRE